MRTAITLEEDVAALVRRNMADRGVTFEGAVNDAIRKGLARTAEPYRVRPTSMGAPRAPLTKALQLAGQREDEAIIDKLALRE